MSYNSQRGANDEELDMTNQTPRTAQSPSITPSEVNPAHESAGLRFDFEAYKKYVTDFDLTEKQQCELLAAIWVIVVNYVNFGFGVHPTQQIVSDENALVVDSPAMLASPDIQFTHSEHDATQTQFVGREDRFNEPI